MEKIYNGSTAYFERDTERKDPIKVIAVFYNNIEYKRYLIEEMGAGWQFLMGGVLPYNATPEKPVYLIYGSEFPIFIQDRLIL